MEFKTTFTTDFSIADRFGKDAIKDTYERAFKEWNANVEYMAELSIVLNHKCWYYYDQDDQELSELYSNLFYKNHYWCQDHFKGADARTYFKMTD